MLLVFDPDAPQRPTNLSVNSDLLAQASDLRINISALLEITLAEKVRQERRKNWLRENGEAIAHYNKTIADGETFSDGFRPF